MREVDPLRNSIDKVLFVALERTPSFARRAEELRDLYRRKCPVADVQLRLCRIGELPEALSEDTDLLWVGGHTNLLNWTILSHSFDDLAGSTRISAKAIIADTCFIGADEYGGYPEVHEESVQARRGFQRLLAPGCRNVPAVLCRKYAPSEHEGFHRTLITDIADATGPWVVRLESGLKAGQKTLEKERRDAERWRLAFLPEP